MKKIIFLVFLFFVSVNFSYSQSGWYQQVSGTNAHLTKVNFINPNTGWISTTNNYVLMTTNGGVYWMTILMPDSAALYSIRFFNLLTGYTCGGVSINPYYSLQKLFKTTNGGYSWFLSHQETGFFTTENFTDVFPTENDKIFMTRAGSDNMSTVGALLMSADGGTNFSSQIGINQNYNGISFINQFTGWVISFFNTDVPDLRTRIFKTSNSGNNWVKQFDDSGAIVNNRMRLTRIQALNENIIYIIGQKYSQGSIFVKSTNGGYMWDTARYTHSKYNALFFVDANTGWIGGDFGNDSSAIAKTTNAGMNWSLQHKNILTIVKDIFFIDNKTGWAVGYNGLILKTVSGGVSDTVTPKYFPLAVGNVYKYHFSSSAGFYYDHKIRIIKDTIINYKKYFVMSGGFPGAGGSIIRYDSLTGNNYYRSNSGYCSYSPFEVIIDSLASSKGDTINRCSSTYKRFCADTSSGNLFGVPVKSKSFRWNGFEGYEMVGYSTGFGVTGYFIQDFQTIASDQLVGCYINGVLYGDTNDITYSVSGSVKYTDNNQPVTNGWVKAIKLDKNTANIIVLDSAAIQSNGSYTLTKVPQDSVDIGIYPNSTPPNDWVITYYPSTTYWENAITLYPTGNLTNINIGAIRMTATTNNNSVNGKVIRLTDNPLANLKDAVLYAKSGNTFVRCAVSDGNGVYHLNSLPTGNLKIIVNRLGFTSDSTMVNVTSTSNIDSINFYLNRVPVGIKQISSNVPSEYKLYQNYPNPFNPTTSIRYSVSSIQNVKLVVYNILGKEVVTLVNEKQSPGVYEVIFNGGSLSSGIYFYTLMSGEFKSTKRFVLIK